MKLRKTPRTPLQLFFGLCFLNAALFFLLLPALGQHGFDWVVMENNSHFESADYFLCLLYSLGGARVYQFGVDACYSPLSYAVFAFFSRATSAADLFQGTDLLQVPYVDLIDLTPTLLTSPYQLMAYLIYLLAGVSLCLLAVRLLALRDSEKTALTACVLCSVPLLFGAVERGNLTLYVAPLVLLAWKLRDSERPLLRELALVLIAVAAGLKFYPAFLGLLYLKEKRWKEAARLIVYGAVCVFVPFAFYGGLDGLRLLLANLSQLTAGTDYFHRVQFFQGVLTFFHISGRLARVLNLVFLLGLVMLFWCTKDRVRRMTYLAAMLAFYPPNGYRYMLLFFLLPLFAWAEERSREAAKPAARQWFEAVLFAAVFSVPTLFGLLTGFRLSFGSYTLTYVEFFIYAAAWALLALAVCGDLSAFKRRLCHV